MKRLALLSIAALLVAATPSHASLVAIGYNVGLLIAPPPSVLPGALASNIYVWLFQEANQVTLTAPLAVDINAPGTYTMRSQLVTGSIPAGTVVNSYYVHTNPVQSKAQWLNQIVGFSSEETIIGVMATAPTLAAGVPAVGAPHTAYNSANGANGVKLAPAGKDMIQISSDGHTVTFSEQMKATVVTEFRIITTLAPQNIP